MKTITCLFAFAILALQLRAGDLSYDELAAYPALRYKQIYVAGQIISDSSRVEVLTYPFDALYEKHTKPGFQQLRSFPNLQYLELSNCFLQVIPAEIFELHKMMVLDLSNNPLLVDLHQDISALSALEELDLRGCSSLRNVEHLAALKSLRFLRLSGLTELPQGLGTLTQLTQLEIDDSPQLQWNDVISILGRLPNLQKLVLRNNAFRELPAGIENLRLQELDLSSNAELNWSTTCDRLHTQEKLHVLVLQSCFERGELSPAINTMTHLAALDLSSNLLGSQWSSVLKGLPLLELHLSGCTLSGLPADLPSEIETLDLSNNPFTKIPDAVFSLKHLKSLDVSLSMPVVAPLQQAAFDFDKRTVKQLSTLPLKSLNMRGRLVARLPSNLFLLSQLEVLNISCMGLSSIPASLKNLRNLKELTIQACEYSTIPSTDHNSGTTAPTPFSLTKAYGVLQSLPSLRVVDLRFNVLQPSELDGLRSNFPDCFFVYW